MRRFSFRLTLSALPLAVVLAGAPASAQEPELTQEPGQSAVEQIVVAGEDEPVTLDSLLADLKREREARPAQRIANQITARWNESGSATVDLLLEWAKKAIEEKRNPAALDFLDQAIVLRPDFVGSWNQRATLHFIMGNHQKSVADIEKVLELEPRHFGALAGFAAILADRGAEEASLSAWERYLEIYPADRQAQEFVIKLSEKLAGTRT